MIHSWSDVDIPSVVVLLIVIGVFIWSQIEEHRSERRLREFNEKRHEEKLRRQYFFIKK